MRPRAVRATYRVLLSDDGSLDRARTLSEEQFWGGRGAFPSQRRFLVSPDGRHLAWADTRTGDLRVRDRSGAETAIPGVHGGDARFSADGSKLAASVNRGVEV